MMVEGGRESLLQKLALVEREDGSTGETIFDDRVVDGACQWVEASGVLEQIARWREADRVGVHPGGAPAKYGNARDRLVLVLMLLLLHDSKAPQMAEMQRAVRGRLTPQARERLGLPVGDKASPEAVYSRIRRAWDRLTDTIDLAPSLLGKRRPTRAEVVATKAARDPEECAKKRARAYYLMNMLLDASVRLTPDEDLRTWRGNISLDATVALVPGRRWKTKVKQSDDKMNRDIDADYHHNHDDTLVPGFDVHIALMVQNDPDADRTFPLLAIAATLDVPNKDVGLNAVQCAQSIKDRGYPIGLFTTDKGYYGNESAVDFHQPLMRMGYGLVGEPKHLKGSNAIQFSHAGVPYIDGAYYSPAMPQDLVNARVDFEENHIDEDTFRERIEQRRKYLFRQKSGRAWMCPAQGAGATVACVHRDFWEPSHLRRDGSKRTRIRNAPDPMPACLNKSSTSLPGIEEPRVAKFAQALHYGSEEHKRMYRLHRSTIEGFNSFAKDDRHQALGLTRNRRRRGMVHHILVVAVTLAVTNMRKIKAFLAEKHSVSPLDPEGRRVIREKNPYEEYLPEDSEWRDPPPEASPGHPAAA